MKYYVDSCFSQFTKFVISYNSTATELEVAIRLQNIDYIYMIQ